VAGLQFLVQARDSCLAAGVLHRTRLALHGIKHTPTPDRAAHSRHRVPQRIHIVDDVGAGRSGRGHHAGLLVSMEIVTSKVRAMRSMIGTTRSVSTDSSTPTAPGRVVLRRCR